ASALVLFLHARPVRRLSAVIGVVGFVCLLALGLDHILPLLDSASSLGRVDADNVTLTGRLPIWTHVLAYVGEHPLQGYGFDAFWTPKHLLEFARLGWSIPNAHSVYMDLSLSL